MGQKVNPVGFRLGVNRGWDSVWFARKKEFGNYFSTAKTWSPNMNNDSRIKTLSLWYKAIERSKHWL